MDSVGSDARSANESVVQGCQRSVKPNKASVNGRDYTVTDENRDEMMTDFLNPTQVHFAEKWSAFYRGPTNRQRLPAGETAKKKEESS